MDTDACLKRGRSPLGASKPSKVRLTCTSPRPVVTSLPHSLATSVAGPAAPSTPVQAPDRNNKPGPLRSFLIQSEDYLGHYAAFLRTLRRELPPFAWAEVVEERPGIGFFIRSRFPDAFRIVAERLDCGFQMVGTPAVSVTVRGVPRSVPLEDVEADLGRALGDRLRAVRRLHASTEGQVDLDRPLPVIVVTLEADAVADLRKWRLFDVVPVHVSRPEQRSPQCRRCFAWGHTAAACKAKRRCFTCGESNHLASECPSDGAPRRCLNCGGDHRVLWGGCPARRKEDRRARQIGTRQPVRNKSFPAARVVPGLSFRDAVAGPAIQPLPQPAQKWPSRIWSHLPHQEEEKPAAVQGLVSPPPVAPPRQQRRQGPSHPRKEQMLKMARQLTEERSRRDALVEELTETRQATKRQPNPFLRQKVRTLRRQLQRSRQRMASLNVSRLEDDDLPPQQQESSRPATEAVNQAISVLRGMMSGIDPTLATAIEAVLQLVLALQCR